jgi:hypothetical protein
MFLQKVSFSFQAERSLSISISTKSKKNIKKDYFLKKKLKKKTDC